jgi:hypothetical protein
MRYAICALLVMGCAQTHPRTQKIDWEAMGWRPNTPIGVPFPIGSAASETVAPDGRKAYILQCKSLGDCWVIVVNYCPTGYSVLASDDEEHPLTIGGSSSFGQGWSNGWRASGQSFGICTVRSRFNVMVVCKAPIESHI